MIANQFHRDRLPEPLSYYQDTAGLTFQQRSGKWRNVVCLNCDSNAMRINVETGAFVCMAACGARGGDVLAYHMAAHGLGFVEAAKALHAWDDNGQPYTGNTRPAQPPARALLQLASDDLMLCAVVLSDARAGTLTDADYDVFRGAAGRVIHIAGVAQHV